MMPTQAIVPTTVETTAASRAMNRVLQNAFRICGLLNMSWYHLSVKPFHTPMVFVSLKLSTMSVRMGRYRNSRMMIR